MSKCSILIGGAAHQLTQLHLHLQELASVSEKFKKSGQMQICVDKELLVEPKMSHVSLYCEHLDLNARNMYCV